ncbi:MAG: ammonium transporter [Alphaproteobacteria bacterium]|nr:ammonium transporter [Alphaproteobacteria bacterium]
MRYIICLISILFSVNANANSQEIVEPNAVNTLWMLVSAALVMIMTPGVAFFYAGMVSHRSVISTLLQNFIALSVVGVLWVVVGYSLSFGEGNAFLGSATKYLMLYGVHNEIILDAKVTHLSFIAFQMMFACITPALMTGAMAERVNFKAWILVLMIWSLVVYAPVAHWVWGPGGWIGAHGALDFAGGLVVHTTAGVGGLVSALVVGSRAESNTYSKDVSMVMLGGTLLWFGWFGFNAGSAIVVGQLASYSFMTTFVAAAIGMIVWMLVDWLRNSKFSAIGGMTGAIVGLVAITPAAGYVSISSSIFIGTAAAIVCNLSSHIIKNKTKLDDTLDVFACHGIGGIVGSIMTGLLASKVINPSIGTE